MIECMEEELWTEENLWCECGHHHQYHTTIFGLIPACYYENTPTWLKSKSFEERVEYYKNPENKRSYKCSRFAPYKEGEPTE
jgi:hypothetical protein